MSLIFENKELTDPKIEIKHQLNADGIVVDVLLTGVEGKLKYSYHRNLGIFLRTLNGYTKTVKSDNSQDLKDLFSTVTLESLGVKDTFKIDVDIKYYVEITAENQGYFPVKIGTMDIQLKDYNGKKVIERYQQGQIERLFNIQFGELVEVNLKEK